MGIQNEKKDTTLAQIETRSKFLFQPTIFDSLFAQTEVQ